MIFICLNVIPGVPNFLTQIITVKILGRTQVLVKLVHFVLEGNKYISIYTRIASSVRARAYLDQPNELKLYLEKNLNDAKFTKKRSF